PLRIWLSPPVRSNDRFAAPASLSWSVKFSPSVLPWTLKDPAPKSPCAHSWSVHAARVTAAPTPRTRPPARSALTLRERVLFVRGSVTLTPPSTERNLLIEFRLMPPPYL